MDAVASAPLSTVDGGPNGAPPTVRTLTADERKTVLRELSAARRLARTKDWSAALAALERALVLEPENARLLAETGWIALQAGELRRAEATSKRALANTTDPTLRAQILYNTGRIAEAANNNDEAKKAYQSSLALRSNATVMTRLESIGGTFVAEDGPQLPCLQAHADVDALCACLLQHNESLDSLGSTSVSCSLESEPALPDPRLSLVAWGGGSGGGGETVHILVVTEGRRARIVADLAHDLQPNMFAAHNLAEVSGAELRTVAGHTIAVVRSMQSHIDSEYGGIEVTSDHQNFETVCALGDTPGATRCTPAIPIEAASHHGVEMPDPADLTDEVKQMLENVDTTQSDKSVKTAWTIASNGKVSVRVVKGAKGLVPDRVLGSHVLW